MHACRNIIQSARLNGLSHAHKPSSFTDRLHGLLLIVSECMRSGVMSEHAPKKKLKGAAASNPVQFFNFIAQSKFVSDPSAFAKEMSKGKLSEDLTPADRYYLATKAALVPSSVYTKGITKNRLYSIGLLKFEPCIDRSI